MILKSVLLIVIVIYNVSTAATLVASLNKINWQPINFMSSRNELGIGVSKNVFKAKKTINMPLLQVSLTNI